MKLICKTVVFDKEVLVFELIVGEIEGACNVCLTACGDKGVVVLEYTVIIWCYFAVSVWNNYLS